MKLNKILILLSFIFIFITGVQAKVTINQNGQKMEYFLDSNDKIHGPVTWFFSNGRIEQKINYRHGEFHGLSTVYHSPYQKKSIDNYKDGVLHGLSQYWNEYGVLLSEGNYVDGEYFARNTNFIYANGDKYVGEYKDNMWHGQGALTSIDVWEYVGEFKYDMWHGQGTWTFASGAKYVGEFKDNKMNGYNIIYKSDGSILLEGIFKDNEFLH